MIIDSSEYDNRAKYFVEWNAELVVLKSRHSVGGNEWNKKRFTVGSRLSSVFITFVLQYLL